MATLGDFINNGQQRRSWLDENVADFVEYLTPPNLRPAAEFAAQVNPVQGMSDMMSSYGVATDPARSMDERRRAAINAVTEGAIALAPAALGAAGYMKPAQAAMEGLLGGSPATKQIGDDMGRFLVDEAGNIRVWHGSPHDFDKFSMDKIGTGEGAQAYGHGLYFAENEDVARGYQQALSRNIDGLQDVASRAGLGDDAAELLAQQYLHDFNGLGFDEWLKFHNENPSQGMLSDRVYAALNEISEKSVEASDAVSQMKRPGHLYEVNIDANPEDFLDWDAPLSAQPEGVRRALADIDRDMWHPAGDDYDPSETGGLLYQRLVEMGNREGAIGEHLGPNSPPMKSGPKWATEALKGVSGISYLDAGSREAADGTRNYVVFDDGLLSMLSKDGK